jgi:hypothetical protein
MKKLKIHFPRILQRRPISMLIAEAAIFILIETAVAVLN